MSAKFSLYDHHGFSQSQALARENRNKKAKRLFKVLVYAILGVLLLVFIAKLPSIVGRVLKPFPNVQNNLVNYNKIDFRFRTNILLITYFKDDIKEISIGSLDSTDKKVQLLKMKPDQMIYTSEGDTTLAKIFQTKTRTNLYLEKLTASIIKTLGLAIDGYILIDQESNWQDKASLEKIANDIYTPGFFFGVFGVKSYLDLHLKTSLSVWELNTLVNKIKNLRPDRFSIINLAESSDEQGYLEPRLLGGKLGLLLNDSLIAKEELTVSVVNASGVEGVGNVFKDILTNLGINVVDVVSAESQEHSEIVNKKKTVLDERLDNLFKEELKTSSDKVIDVDEKLIIGKDLANYFVD